MRLTSGVVCGLYLFSLIAVQAAKSAESNDDEGGVYATLGDNKAYFISSDSAVGYFDAEYACVQRNMKLVSIQTEDKNNMIVQYLNNNTNLDWFTYWTDGVCNGNGQFAWSTTGDTVIYTNWAQEQPDQCIYPRNSFLLISLAYFNRQWEDYTPIEFLSEYICESLFEN